MSTVLLLSIPAHGHVNPLLGLAAGLVERGETVLFFASELFRDRVEATGARFRSYRYDLDLFAMPPEGQPDPMIAVTAEADEIIASILDDLRTERVDYIVHSAPFPFAMALGGILGVPQVSSLAVFAGLAQFFEKDASGEALPFPGMEAMQTAYRQSIARVEKRFSVRLPDDPLRLLFQKGALNLVYTSEYFIDPADRAFFDDTHLFIGPPVYARREENNIRLQKVPGRPLIYISLGTVFGNALPELYPLFFEAFGGGQYDVIMAAHHMDLSGFTVPANFTVRDYVPQHAVLAIADAAITHAGMNSISDILYHNVPFICIPLGADQPELAARAAALGATISLDAAHLSAQALRDAIGRVRSEPGFRAEMRTIRASFEAAGGYPRAIDAIFKLKRRLDI